MDEKKEEKIVIESQKEEIKTDTEKTERSRNRITKIKQIKVKKGIRNAVIVVIAIIAIFIAMLILDKSQHTFNGQVLKLVGITEKKQEDEEDKKERAKAVKVAQEKFKELGEKTKKENLEVLKIKRKGEYYYYISAKENTVEVRIKDNKIKVNNVLGMGNPYNYRNKAQYPVGTNKNGEKVFGVFAKRTHEIIPIKECKIQKEISLNVIANILGLGNAATPLGLKAMKSMQKKNPKKDTLTNSMITFIVLNTASLQIIPTTVIAIRSSMNSKNPTSIVFPVWIATICAAIAGITATKLFIKLTERKK